MIQYGPTLHLCVVFGGRIDCSELVAKFGPWPLRLDAPGTQAYFKFLSIEFLSLACSFCPTAAQLVQQILARSPTRITAILSQRHFHNQGCGIDRLPATPTPSLKIDTDSYSVLDLFRYASPDDTHRPVFDGIVFP